MTKTSVATLHPFGELLTQYRRRKAGLTQTRLAELAGYDQAILVRMCKGKKDLTGPSGRERVVRLIETLAHQGALTLLDEANALLLAADMPPLFDRHAVEARLIEQLSRMPQNHRLRRTNLPAALTSFIGRTQEIAEVRRLLNTTRLLTLTGSGGCGKTRLAQRVAADVLIAYSDGVWYAELAAITDPALISEIVVRALGLPTLQQSAQEQALEFLRERQVLLVLDNCEHLIDAIAKFAIELLRACPRVTILATSREAFNIDGEMTWRVPPMHSSEASQLFFERAAASSQTDLSGQSQTISTICNRLDGIPLAIELAAARLNALSIGDISARLNDRLNLLTQGRRGSLPRHQTLRAMIDWSYDGLSASEKAIFCQIGIFADGWELAEAEQLVLVDSANTTIHSLLDHRIVLTTMAQLVHKSLVVVDVQHNTTRYRFLETIREYALEKLAIHNTVQHTRRRHAEIYLQLVEQSTSLLHGAQQQTWLEKLTHEYPNLLAALTWCFESGGDPLMGCRFVGALYHYWIIATRRRRDASKWAAIAAKSLTDDMPASIRAWVLLTKLMTDWKTSEAEVHARYIHQLFLQAGDHVHAAYVKPMIGEAIFYANRDFIATRQISEEGVEEARNLKADWVLRRNLWMLGQCLRFSQQDPQRAEAVYRESAALSKAAGDMHEYAYTLGLLINGYAIERFQFDEAIQSAEEALKYLLQKEDIEVALFVRCSIAECHYYIGNISLAQDLLEDCRAIAIETLTPFQETIPMTVLARIAISQNNYDDAHRLLKEALTMRVRAAKTGEFVGGIYTVTDALSAIAMQRDNAMRAARLRGVADLLYLKNHHYRRAHIKKEFEPYIAKARAALGEDAYQAAYAEGYAMPLDQAIAYALSDA